MLRRTTRVLSAVAPKPQSTAESTLEQVPVVGPVLVHAKKPETWQELAEIRRTEADPAAAVTERFIEAQKKLVAVRFHRIRTEVNELANGRGADGATAVIIARTVVLALLGYSFAYYLESGLQNGIPVIGQLFGKPADLPPHFWEKGYKPEQA